MPFGAAETMMVHEILSEKICMIDHFALYAAQCQDAQLKQMIQRHMQTAIHSYNQLVAYTHDYRSVQQHSAGVQASPQQIQYGLRHPAGEAPVMQAGPFNDRQIAASVLLAHKNSAKNHLAASLECADPNVRQMLLNGAWACANQQYEVFLYMNQRGMYQVPTMDEHTAKTLLHHYQPVAQAPGYPQQNRFMQQGMQGQPMTEPSMTSQQNMTGQAVQRSHYEGNPYLM